MVMGGVEDLVFGFENEGGRNCGVTTTRLVNDGKNLPKSNSKFTSSVLKFNLILWRIFITFWIENICCVYS